MKHKEEDVFFFEMKHKEEEGCVCIETEHKDWVSYYNKDFTVSNTETEFGK